MLNFLFWNVNKRPLAKMIINLVHESEVDIIILAESEINDAELLAKMNVKQKRPYHVTPGISLRLRMYSRYVKEFIRPIRDSGSISIREFALPLRKEVLLVAVHLRSKLHADPDDQFSECIGIAREIEKAEESVGHSRTIVVGDFNMNPFESGLIGTRGFHAVLDKRIAERKSRIVQGERFKFFYNPMWNLFGKESPGPIGTYYYDDASHTNRYWNMFDQVLVRPSLMDSFWSEELKVLTDVGKISLMTGLGRPNRKVGSDHFPILFKVDI